MGMGEKETDVNVLETEQTRDKERKKWGGGNLPSNCVLISLTVDWFCPFDFFVLKLAGRRGWEI